MGSTEERQHVLAVRNAGGTSHVRDEPTLAKSVKLRIHLDDLRHPVVNRFLGTIDSSTVLETAIEHVFKHLYAQCGTPQAVRSVTLILEPMGGVAYTTGIALDDSHKEIHVSLEYLAHRIDDPVAFQKETMGVIVHEMVHCWQHNAKGTAPGGLIEGIADYVRLKSGLSPPHWHKSREQCGQKWDEGYQKTAWFLEWLEDEHGKGLVSKINSELAGVKYDESKFWHSLCGATVGELWKRYLDHWDKDKTPAKPGSETGTEPELVELDEKEKIEAAQQNEKQPKQFNA